MNRVLALIISVCVLAGSVIAPMSDTAPADTPPQPGTRADAPLMIIKNITHDYTWGTNYSFIYIMIDLWVEADVTLTIEPGTVVKFDPGTSLHVRGGIIADGLPSQNVTFMPFIMPAAPMDWEGITLENATDPCVFDNVNITFSSGGIACWGTDAIITNSTISSTQFYGILCGQNSAPLVRNNFINAAEWTGIICENRSNPYIRYNRIELCYYGIVCYDVAEILGNRIENCLFGIVGWGNSTISANEIVHCRDGIHAFYASPVIENNVIMYCTGNGTRFFHSSATFRNNRFAYNYVGIDINYESRSILDHMDNNLVNGIEITDCYYVGEKDIVIDNFFIDSGWSVGYSGSINAQGSITLYDCENVTVKNSTILNSMNSFFVSNSTFTIYNSTLGNAVISQINLDQNATGTGFNNSVDPDQVRIGGINCLFQTFDDLKVMVLDYYHQPLQNATVVVEESHLELFNVSTGADGLTVNMVVKDRTVSDAGVIYSPLDVYVYAENYSFAPNPLTGVYVSQDDLIIFRDRGDVFPPSVISYSITNGDRAFPVNGTITFTFSEPMNKTSVEAAFSFTANVTVTFVWNEDNTSVTFVPSQLAHSTYYTLTLSAGAMDLWDNSIEDPLAISFTTVQAPGASSGTIMGVAIAILVIAGISGFLALRMVKSKYK